MPSAFKITAIVLSLLVLCGGCGSPAANAEETGRTVPDMPTMSSALPREVHSPSTTDERPTPGLSPSSVAASASPAPTEKKKIVAIDAGHQQKRNHEQEEIGPGTTDTKAKVSSGTTGVSTKVPEYELNLTVALKLKEELLARGYEVFMIRETHDVDISNKERAGLAEEAGADIIIRIHANGSTDQTRNGILMVTPPQNSPFIPHLYDDCRRLAELLLEEMVSATGANRMGIWETNSMSGINWASMPVVLVEMGYMTNPNEDELMQTQEYQDKLVDGMAYGIDRFFQDG